jgi:hypothetical protein
MTGTFDLDAAFAFVRLRFAIERQGHLVFMFVSARGGVPIHRHVPLDREDRWLRTERYLRQFLPDHNCYLAVAVFATAPRSANAPQRSKAMVGHLPCLICERDAAPLSPLLPPPSWIVESSPGRYQDYWQLDRPIDILTYERAVRRIVGACGVGNQAVDAVRVLRLPGSINFKPEYAQPLVQLVHDDGTIYPRAAFDHLPDPVPTVSRSRMPADERIAAGQRNVALFALGRAMRFHRAGVEAIQVALESVNQSQCDPPLDAAEIAGILRSIIAPARAGVSDVTDSPIFKGALSLRAHGFSPDAITAAIASEAHARGMVARVVVDAVARALDRVPPPLLATPSSRIALRRPVRVEVADDLA